MTDPNVLNTWVGRELRALGLAVAFMTRLPVAGLMAANAGDESRAGDLAAAARYFPITGLLVGGAAALLFWGLDGIDMPLTPAALITVLFQVWLVRGLHEDGLADLADGLGGGWTPEKRLEIMKDSRSGAFGVMALIGAIGLRTTLLAALAQNDICLALSALILAAVLSRLSMLGLLIYLPPVRAGGLGSSAAGGASLDLLAGGAVSLVLLLVLESMSATLILGLVVIAMTALFAWKARRALGGQTGDVLGAMQQLAEVGVLITLVVLAG